MRVRTGAAAITLSLLAAAAAAQQPASPYVPLGDWRSRFAEHLITAGVVPDPTPFERPAREAALRRALDTVCDSCLAPSAQAMLGRLRNALRGPADGELRLAVEAGATGGSHVRRDPLRPVGAGYAAPFGGVSADARIGSLVLAIRPWFDNRLKTDPDWHGFTRRVVAGRQAVAYAELQSGAAELFFGTLDRNWGPPVMPGLLRSDAPYGYDHVGWGITTRRARLHGFVAQLDDYVDSAGAVWHRWYLGTRLAIQPSDRWMLAVWQGSLVSGPNRGLELWYLNPLNATYLVQANDDNVYGNSNQLMGVDLQVSAGRAARLFGQLLLDDVQVDRELATDTKPIQAGLTVGASGGLGGGGRAGGVAWTMFYTAVTNLAYRTQNGVPEQVRRNRVGLARDLADYDQLTARVSWLARGDLLVAPEVTLLRRGEGDFRQPLPAPAEWPRTTTILSGVVERTVRAAVRADYAGPGGLYAWVDGGVHLVANRGHVAGASRTVPVWQGGIGWQVATHVGLR